MKLYIPSTKTASVSATGLDYLFNSDAFVYPNFAKFKPATSFDINVTFANPIILEKLRIMTYNTSGFEGIKEFELYGIDGENETLLLKGTQPWEVTGTSNLYVPDIEYPLSDNRLIFSSYKFKVLNIYDGNGGNDSNIAKLNFFGSNRKEVKIYKVLDSTLPETRQDMNVEEFYVTETGKFYATKNSDGSLLPIGGQSSSSLTYTLDVLSTELTLDSESNLYYIDITHNLNTDNINVYINNSIGSCMFSYTAKTSNGFRLWLMENEDVSVIVSEC